MATNAIMISNHTPVLPSGNAIEAAWRLAELAYKSGMSKAKTQADAFFVIMYGYELGVSPMTSLRSIYSVGGAPSCSGELMLALIRNSGKAETIKLPDSKEIADGATVYMKRQDTGEEYTAMFTLKQAETAGLVKDGSNWKKYPKAMLLWRAVSICAKALFSDVIAGLYTLEEIAPNTPVDETGAPIGAIIEGDFIPAPQLPSNAALNNSPGTGDNGRRVPPQELGVPPPDATEPPAAQNDNKPKHNIGAVHGLVAFLYKDDFHRGGSIVKLLEGRNTDDPENAIKPEDSTNQAASKVVFHRAFEDYGFSRDKFWEAINAGLTENKVANFAGWLKLCGDDMAAALKSAWKAVQEYAELEKLPPATPAKKGKKTAPKPETPAEGPADDLDNFIPPKRAKETRAEAIERDERAETDEDHDLTLQEPEVEMRRQHRAAEGPTDEPTTFTEEEQKAAKKIQF